MRKHKEVDASCGLMARLRRLLGDKRGVAAVEFAFIAPLLLSLYFMTMEVSQGIETNKKVGRIGSMVADLITQNQEISRTELEAVMEIGGAIVQPYNRSLPSVRVVAIRITDEENPKARVAWSRKMVGGTFSSVVANDTVVDIPDKLKIRNTFLIQVTGELNYRPVIAWTANGVSHEDQKLLGLGAAFDNIEMAETYYLRPRMSPEIPCKGC